MQSKKTILSIHQPNFLPWLGYFDKINKSDIFIILDNVQMPRGKSIANRNAIKTSRGKSELVVPLTKPKGFEGKVTYNMVQTADQKWAGKALKTIELNYAKATYFKKYFPVLQNLFEQKNFCRMNIDFVKYAASELEIDTPIILLSDLTKNFGTKNELIVNLCHHFNADIYLSGKGAKKYNDREYMNKKGIELVYQQFEHPVYQQLHGEFIPCLSVMDLLMNHGPESKQYL